MPHYIPNEVKVDLWIKKEGFDVDLHSAKPLIDKIIEVVSAAGFQMRMNMMEVAGDPGEPKKTDDQALEDE